MNIGNDCVQIKQAIEKEIETGILKPGSRIYSENELCRKYNVSRHTVRRALGILSEQGILVRKKGIGTYVADIKQTAKSMSVCVISPFLDDYIFPKQIKGIENILTANGYHMQIGITYNKFINERRILSAMLENPLDGIIAEPAKSALPTLNADIYTRLYEMGVPIVFINTKIPSLQIPCISIDDRKGGYIATKHLIDMGHKKIGIIAKMDDYKGHLRFKGYMDAICDANISFPMEESMIWFSTEWKKELFNGAFGMDILSRLRECSALFCYNDQIAYVVIELLKQKGVRVPDDISIVSYDNSDYVLYTSPNISSIEHPSESLGAVAAKNLLRLIKDPNFDANYLFEPTLICRDSVNRIDK
jgi:GntR family transcriptional regulator of arabinose operon